MAFVTHTTGMIVRLSTSVNVPLTTAAPVPNDIVKRAAASRIRSRLKRRTGKGRPCEG